MRGRYFLICNGIAFASVEIQDTFYNGKVRVTFRAFNPKEKPFTLFGSHVHYYSELYDANMTDEDLIMVVMMTVKVNRTKCTTFEIKQLFP